MMAAFEDPRWTLREDRLRGQTWIVGYFSGSKEARSAWKILAPGLERVWLDGSPEFSRLPDTDWKESYKRHFKAWHLGRLHWVPEWKRSIYRVPPGDSVVLLDPGMAFGTGNHATTRLCCRRLSEFARRHPQDAAGKGRAWSDTSRVIDVGCGSGILAISAVKLGLSPVLGFDNDPVSVRVSRENAALNGVSGGISFFRAGVTGGLSGRSADLILANILANVLIRFADDLVRAVTPRGWLVLSGILVDELPGVRRRFRMAAPGWRIDSRSLREWADLRLIRPR